MIRTEKGYGQIFKIYGVSETEVKDALKEILNQGSTVPVYQDGGARRSMCWQKRRRLMKNGQRSF